MTTVHGNQWWKKKHYHPKNTLGFRSKSISCGEKTTLNRVDIHAVWASGSRVAIASAAHGGGGEHNRLLVELKKNRKLASKLEKVRKSVLNIEPGEWMNVVFIKQKKLQFPRSKKTISIRETSLTSKELWSVQKVKNQHGWVSMSLLLHSLFCTVSKLEKRPPISTSWGQKMGANFCNSGKTIKHGYSRIDAYRAL